MLIIKVVLGTLIVIITTCLGIMKSRKLYTREYILKEYISFLNNVENDIKYCLTILPNAYESARIKLKTDLKEVIGMIVQDMLDGKDVDKSIVNNINKIEELTSYDKNLISSTLRNLGKSDVEAQINILRNNIKVIEKQVKEAEEIKLKNSKLYRTIGTVSGLAIVIIFI